MFAIVQNNTIMMLVQPGTAFEWDGIQYPANWCNLSSPEEKSAIGMVDVVYGPQQNDQFYWVSQDSPVYNQVTNQVDINYTSTPKDLVQCQTNVVSSTNSTAYSILLPTDWMVVKAMETGSTVAPEWNTWRQEIRNQAAAYVAVVNACTTTEELAALPSVQWALSPDAVVTQ